VWRSQENFASLFLGRHFYFGCLWQILIFAVIGKAYLLKKVAPLPNKYKDIKSKQD